MAKETLKHKTIKLRKLGKTYSEILKVVPVAKSTLSLWLRKVSLSFPQTQRISELRKAAQRKGAAAQKQKRIKKEEYLIRKAQDEIISISWRELWLIGIALYWAEGSKAKIYRPTCRTSFSNSDPKMIALFIKWLNICLKIDSKDLILSIYIHESHSRRIDEIKTYWSQYLNLPLHYFKGVYLKKNKINTQRKNVGALYMGLLRVNIKSSSDLNRSILGWINGICVHCGIV